MAVSSAGSATAVSAALEAAADGSLTGAGPVRLALTGERLQGLVRNDGVHELLVWGSGAAAGLRFEPSLPLTATVRVTPNRLDLRWDEGWLRLSALPRAPAILLRGGGRLPTLRLVRSRRVPEGFAEPARRLPSRDGWAVRAAWSHTLVRAPGGAALPGGRLSFGTAGVACLAAGAESDEAERAAAWVARDPIAAEAELDTYQAALAAALHLSDPVLQSLVLHGLHAAFSARRTLADDRFAGVAAGVGYALPARTYYRDSYWSLQALLPLAPALAREQLVVLARGLHPDGEAPSGVVIASPAGERSWRAARAADPALARDHPRAGEWWADHVDAPLFFVLLACDVAAWSDDPGLFALEVDGRSLGARVADALERVHASCDASGLPLKPAHDRDWADNVFRGGYVTYLAGLYHGALTRVAALIASSEPERAARYRARAAALRAGARRWLWRDDLGHFVEFREPAGRSEAHLAIDTVTALRFDLADANEAERVLAAMRARLETRHNTEQPYGDWGVMSVFPPYAPWVRRRGKSRFAYRYHNGGDWPYWDGVYAEQRLRRGVAGWRYPLTRWWTYGLARGWATPVEYHAPPYAPGSPSNAWSSMPVAAMLLGGFGLTPRGGARRPPWGPCCLARRLPDGRLQRLHVQDDRLEVEHDGRPVA